VLFRGTLALLLASEGSGRAETEAKKAITIDERHWLPYYALSMNQFSRGELAEARKVAERSVTAAPWMPLPMGLFAGLLRRLGDDVKADTLVSAFQSAGGAVIYHLVCENYENGAESCANAIAQGEMRPLMWIGASAFLRSLRSTTCWSTVVRLMNLPSDAA
jgi:hypothetical protein